MISVIIIAKNEAKKIRRCLESVAWADEIIVLDSGSADNTVAIAREYTDRVYETDWAGYGIQKQRALAYANQPWILNLDADETVEEPLKNEILRAIANTKNQAYRIQIQMSFYGKRLRYSSTTRRVRLFRKDSGYYSDDLVHEKVLLNPKTQVGSLKHPIIHCCYEDLSQVLDKINLYSSYSAKLRHDADKKTSMLRIFSGSLWMFVRCYFLQLGFLDGRDGFLFAVINAQSSFYRGIKLIYPDHAFHHISKIN